MPPKVFKIETHNNNNLTPEQKEGVATRRSLALTKKEREKSKPKFEKGEKRIPELTNDNK